MIEIQGSPNKAAAGRQGMLQAAAEALESAVLELMLMLMMDDEEDDGSDGVVLFLTRRRPTSLRARVEGGKTKTARLSL